MEQLKAWTQKFVIADNEWRAQTVSLVENILRCYLLLNCSKIDSEETMNS